MTTYHCDAEEEFIEDNGDHHLASYDRKTGAAFYTDRSLAKLPGAPVAAAKKAAATAARSSISDFGYKALKSGTSKQKAWAESIRATAVARLSNDIKSGLLFETSAKFFINNRDNFERLERVAIANAESANTKLRIEAERKLRKKTAK